MTDAVGNVVKEVQYDSFGNVLNDTRPGMSHFAFAGGLYDGDTGLVRFGHRDYDAKVGVWTAKDPLLFDADDLSLYSYVTQNPIQFTDSNGLHKEDNWYGITDKAFKDWAHTQKEGRDFTKQEIEKLYDDWKELSCPRGKGGKSGGGGKNRGGTQGGRGAGTCFAKDTKVLTENGLKAIQHISSNEKVLTVNESTGIKEYKKVTLTISAKSQEFIVIDIFSNLIYVTPMHKFHVKGNGWTEARFLRNGDKLTCASGHDSVEILTVNDIYTDQLEIVYNLEVEGNHNYHVTDDLVLVHNLKEGGGLLRVPTSAACFLGTTLLKTRSGMKQIQDVQLYDEVASVDSTDMKVIFQPIVRKYSGKANHYFEIITSNDIARCTGNHRFWVIGRGWIAASKLNTGDKIYTMPGFEKIRRINIVTLDAEIDVFNIEVLQGDNYIVQHSGYIVSDKWPLNTNFKLGYNR